MRDVTLEEAVEVLRSGGLVAFPTETVYGLGADATQPAAVRAIFATKGRPTGHPLILHLASAAELERFAVEVPPAARRLGDVLWPGPLTLILKKSAAVPPEVTGGRDTVGLRVPAHPLALALIGALGRPIAAPSANRFGAVSPTTAAHVRADLADTDVALLDGGPCEVGVESTIVDVTSGVPTILRAGGVPKETLEEVLGAPVLDGTSGEARAPGMLASHYAPRAKVVALAPGEVDAWLAGRHERFVLLSRTARALPAGRHVALPASDADFARTLYATLRELDAEGVPLIAVELPDARGLGWAIADRVKRAAAPR